MAQTLDITIDDLRSLDVFSGLPGDTLEALLRLGCACHWGRNQELLSCDAPVDEHYYFLLRGIVTVAVDPSASVSALGGHSQRPLTQARELLGYFEAGACFSDAFLLEAAPRGPHRLFCIAANDASALRLEKKHLQELLECDKPLRTRLAEHMARDRATFLSRQDPTSRTIQDFFLRENYVTSTVVRLSHLDRCLDCNKCHDACVARHGSARMQRVALRLGRIAFPTTCRSCADRPCIAACGVGGLAFDERSGTVTISEHCTGCGACAKLCPNRAIFMVSQPSGTSQAPEALRLRATEPHASGAKSAPMRAKRQRAVKCDTCAEYPDRACITACPTGALVEIEAKKLFFLDDTKPSSHGRRFSDAPFLRGQSSGQAHWKGWGAGFTLVLLAILGLESYLIHTNPDASWLIRYVRASGSKASVTFTSGQGMGHWFGYIGSGLMLASISYSLRSRIRSLRNWGAQTGWLSAHIWLGFTGAILVTYHSTLKLNRWASIGCILMWLVVTTGIFGRYLFGRVRSAEGLAAFERDAIRNSSGRSTYYAVMESILRRWNIIHIMLVIAMLIVAGMHIVYGFRYKAF